MFCVPQADPVLVAFLNSRLVWFFLFGESTALRGGKWRVLLQAIYVEKIPIPDLPSQSRARLAALGQACTDAARKRWEIIAAVRHRILDLAPPERRKLNGRLEAWHELDFAGFQAEVKKVFHADVPVKQRGEWETYLRENAARVRELAGRISTAEREIDTIVYALFDLTPEEIALLEASLGSILEYTSKIC